MIKKAIAIFLIALALICGYGNNTNAATNNESRFVVVETGSDWYIVADKEEGVMYAVSRGRYNCGTFTVLMNRCGNPLLWDGK